MEDELRLSLLIAGSCFIIAVLAHGIWKIRKHNQATRPNREEPRAWSDDEEQASPDTGDTEDEWQAARSPYDDLGLGEVRVVSKRDADPVESEDTTVWQDDADDEDNRAAASSTSDPEQDTERQATAAQEDKPEDDPAATSSRSASPDKSEAEAQQEAKLYGSVVSNPKPHMQTQKDSRGQQGVQDFPDPPGFLIKESTEGNAPAQPDSDAQDVDSFSLDTQPAEPQDDDNKAAAGLGEHARKLVSRKRSKHTAQKRRQEPNFGDDQMRIDFDEPAAKPEVNAVDTPTEQQKPAQSAEQEVLVLNVKAKADEPISGAALLPLLLTLGFKFGDQDIFHRHVNSNGKGPVLFSLANMFKPGNFDIDNLETFTTQGVSLFMILPIEGDPHQVFNMMHNAGRKIADEFGAQLLDGRRSVLTKQGLQQYNEKIREFERQRMIARH